MLSESGEFQEHFVSSSSDEDDEMRRMEDCWNWKWS